MRSCSTTLTTTGMSFSPAQAFFSINSFTHIQSENLTFTLSPIVGTVSTGWPFASTVFIGETRLKRHKKEVRSLFLIGQRNVSSCQDPYTLKMVTTVQLSFGGVHKEGFELFRFSYRVRHFSGWRGTRV